jgi:signal transduction histidine kinase
MGFLPTFSIRSKQMLISMLTSGVALLLASAGFVIYDRVTVQDEMKQGLLTLAAMLGNNSTGALDFNDRKVAHEVLSALKARSDITAACIYTKEGEVFARYPQQGPGAEFAPPPCQPAGHRFEHDRIVLFQPIIQGDEQLGTIFLQANLDALSQRMHQYYKIAGGVLLAAMLMAFLLSLWFQRFITVPILHLVQATRSVARQKDYVVRVPKESADELGQLIDDFNEMLAQIQARDAALQGAHTQLEQRVIERTQELQAEVAERKRVEGQLLQAQKMEAVGQLAGGIAHDFNNILAATILQLDLVLDEPGLSPQLQADLREVEKGAQRAAELTRQLLLFSRRQIMQIKPLDLNEVLADLLKMLRRLLGEHIDITLHGEPGPLWIDADAGMMQQVVMNLCVNARDAMPQGGRLTLGTRALEVRPSDVLANTEARPGRFVCLSVADSGCGMDPQTLPHIFEPFFTTKEIGRGTGMGLATVYGIVKQHQGWVEVESAVNVGTAFRVYLPARPAAASGASAPAHPPLPRGSETILVVEDDEPLRKLSVMTLQRLGYRVFEASTGAAALRQWNDYEGAIALLLTDMVMPEGINGLDLAQRLRILKPDLKVIVSTGYSQEMARLSASKERDLTFLGKPYEMRLLAITVRECLDRV